MRPMSIDKLRHLPASSHGRSLLAMCFLSPLVGFIVIASDLTWYVVVPAAFAASALCAWPIWRGREWVAVATPVLMCLASVGWLLLINFTTDHAPLAQVAVQIPHALLLLSAAVAVPALLGGLVSLGTHRTAV